MADAEGCEVSDVGKEVGAVPLDFDALPGVDISAVAVTIADASGAALSITAGGTMPEGCLGETRAG